METEVGLTMYKEITIAYSAIVDGCSLSGTSLLASMPYLVTYADIFDSSSLSFSLVFALRSQILSRISRLTLWKLDAMGPPVVVVRHGCHKVR